MGFLEERDLSDLPTIPEYYEGKTIFITGGSGFMGKVLVEKLLYSCSGLDRIYLLLRAKKGVSPKDRLNSIYETKCFDRLRNEKPGLFESKVFFIAGDVMELGLGLSEEDRALLVNRVQIIFHVAASVRFDDPLPYAVRLNLRGTRELIELAKEVRNLSALVHISTCYTNTNYECIEEKMYPPHADWRDTLEICDKLDETTLKVLTPKFMGKLPNTYTFTKQLAEHLVNEQRGKLPVVIIRPSIVISSVEEPMPGWIENFNGPAGLLVACGKGIMRTIYSDPSLIGDYVPVDVSIKGFIAAAWIRGTKKLEPTDEIAIYNCCASNLNHITMGELIEMGKDVANVYPFNGVLWNIGGNITTSKTLHYVKVMLLQLLPALFVDLLLWITGQKPLLVKVQRRIYLGNKAVKYFLTKEWSFDNKNFVQLRSSIKEVDRKQFYYDIENIDKHEYFLKSGLGGRRYLLKEKDEDLPAARRNLTRLIKVQRRIYIANMALQYYVTKQWCFDNKNFIQLRSSIMEVDRKQFYYEIENIDKHEYFLNSGLGGRRYLLKEKDEDLPAARRNLTRMKIIDWTVRGIFFGLLFWWILNTTYVQQLLLAIASVFGY